MILKNKGVWLSLVLGVAAGYVYYVLSWVYHLPYIGLGWLAPLVRADGEKAYDAMLYESLVDFAIMALVLYLITIMCIKYLRARLTRLPLQ